MSGWQLRLIVTQWKWIDPALALDVAEWNVCTLLMDLFNCAVSQGFCAPAMIYPVLGFRRCTGLPCRLARCAQAETWPAQGPRCRDPFKRSSGISQSLSPHCSSEKAALSLTPLSVYLSLFLSLPTSSINSILPKLFLYNMLLFFSIFCFLHMFLIYHGIHYGPPCANLAPGIPSVCFRSCKTLWNESLRKKKTQLH